MSEIRDIARELDRLSRRPIHKVTEETSKALRPQRPIPAVKEKIIESIKEVSTPSPATVPLPVKKKKPGYVAFVGEVKTVEFIACPLCGRSRPLQHTGGGHALRKPKESRKSSRVRFDLVDLEHGGIIQRRTISTEGFKIEDRDTDTAPFALLVLNYNDIALQIKEQCQRILKYFPKEI